MNVPTDFSGARVTVMGLGRFGGGAGVTRWLVSQGADVLLTDLADQSSLAGPLESIADLVETSTVTLRLGGHNVSDFTDCDCVIASPAVPKPWDNRLLRAATAASVPITTEIRLLVERLPNWYRTIGITGTAGKSTTSAMIAHTIRQVGGTAWLGGNIGGSLLNSLDEIEPEHRVILELSSAQLYWLGKDAGFTGAKSWSPACAVVTNIAPNHFDWHGDMQSYAAAKQQIVLGEIPDGWRDSTVILGASIGEEFRVPSSWSVHRVECEHNDFLASVRAHIADLGGLQMPGEHNITNALAAILAVSELPMRDPIAGNSDDIMPSIDTADAPTSRSPSLIAQGIIGLVQQAGEELARAYASAVVPFKGLPHRLEFVGEFDGVRAYNDSKCTTPEGIVMAIRSVCESRDLSPSRIHLICGGYDKGTDLAPMMASVRSCAGVYALGQTGPGICEGSQRAVFFKSLAEAVAAARRASTPGDVILLSPGCASWDQFANYEERGEQFKAAIMA